MDETPDQSGFFNKPAFNAFERILCNHLIEAINSTPLQTVMHIMRAALALNEQESKELEIDQKQAKSLYTIAERTYSTIQKHQENQKEYSLYTSTLDWDQDIKPWITRNYYPYSYDINSPSQEWYDDIKNSEKDRDIFDFSIAHLTESGFNNLCSDFLEYAIPIASEYTRKLSSKISPETYSNMLRDYRVDKWRES